MNEYTKKALDTLREKGVQERREAEDAFRTYVMQGKLDNHIQNMLSLSLDRRTGYHKTEDDEKENYYILRTDRLFIKAINDMIVMFPDYRIMCRRISGEHVWLPGLFVHAAFKILQTALRRKLYPVQTSSLTEQELCGELEYFRPTIPPEWTE